MVTRKEWLAERGLAKLGRGKLSKEANAAIAEAVANGITFDDWDGNGRVSRSNSNAGNTTRNKRSNKSLAMGTGKSVLPAEPKGKDIPFTLPTQTVKHHQSTVYGVDRVGRSEIVIAFQSCYGCNKAIKYCIHDVPQLPAWLGGGDALMENPNAA